MPGQPVNRVVFDDRFERLVPADARVEHLAGGAIWAEGPVYLPDEDARDLERRPRRPGPPLDARPAATARSMRRATSPTATRSIATVASWPASMAGGGSRGTKPTARGRRSWTATRATGSTHPTTSSSRPTARSGSPTRRTESSTTREGHAAESELGGCFVFRLDRDTRRADDRERRDGASERPRVLAGRIRALRVRHVGGADRGRQPPHPRVRRRRRRPAAGESSNVRGDGAGVRGRAPGRRRRQRLDLGRGRDPRPGPTGRGAGADPPARGRQQLRLRWARRPAAVHHGHLDLWSIEVGIRGVATPWV